MLFFPAIDCDPVPYTALLTESTRSEMAVEYKAARPRPSPLETERLERNGTISEYFMQSLEENELEPDLSALENFHHLVALLPAYLPATDPYVSKQGSVVFDWDFKPENQLSVLLKAQGQISFAAYLSGEKVHGSTVFTPTALPASLAAVAKQWADRVGIYPRA